MVIWSGFCRTDKFLLVHTQMPTSLTNIRTQDRTQKPKHEHALCK